MRFLIAAALLLMPCTAWTQAWTPPDCFGENVALQYKGGWLCAPITGAVGPTGPAGPQGPAGPAGPAMPAQPAPTECITSHWSGTAWTCVPTNYLEAK
jgi:hypothetical protein